MGQSERVSELTFFVYLYYKIHNSFHPLDSLTRYESTPLPHIHVMLCHSSYGLIPNANYQLVTFRFVPKIINSRLFLIFAQMFYVAKLFFLYSRKIGSKYIIYIIKLVDLYFTKKNWFVYCKTKGVICL